VLVLSTNEGTQIKELHPQSICVRQESTPKEGSHSAHQTTHFYKRCWKWLPGRSLTPGASQEERNVSLPRRAIGKKDPVSPAPLLSITNQTTKQSPFRNACCPHMKHVHINQDKKERAKPTCTFAYWSNPGVLSDSPQVVRLVGLTTRHSASSNRSKERKN
jgi:hypothetical protein